MRWKRPWTVVLTLSAIWAAVGMVVLMTNAVETTPADVRTYLTRHDPAAAGFVDGLVQRVNALPPAARFDAGLGDDLRVAFGRMEPEQRRQYLAATLPHGFDQMMDAINGMNADQRRSLVDRALAQIDERIAEGGGPPPELDEASRQRIADEGMRAYLADTTAEAKLDLQPLVQRMQEIMRTPPRQGPFGR